jgi:hypothetical protein
MEPSQYVGLDVSQELTAVRVVDQQGTVVWRGNAPPIPMPLSGQSASMLPVSSELGLRPDCCRIS